MKRWRALVVVLAAAALLASPALWSWSDASGVHSEIALFESHVHPDLPFDQFAAGRLGIIQATWRPTFLYVAYRYMAGPGFDAGERKALVSMWNEALGLQLSAAASQWLQANQGIDNGTVVKAGEASSAWLAARDRVSGVGMIDGIGVFRSAPAQFDLFTFANCNDSAFLTAARTLGTMIGKFGRSSPQVKQWVNAQDQVFDNCSDSPSDFGVNTDAWSEMVDEWNNERGKVPGVSISLPATNSCRGMRFRTATLTLETMIHNLGASNPRVKQWVDAQDKALGECSRGEPSAPGGPTPAATPDLPEPLADGTPFERAQRTYQIACAYFYSGNYATAAKMFDQIAADPSSPWRQLAPYLVARATIRKATLSSDKNDHALLAQAEAQLNQIIATPGDDGVKHAAQRLLGFVEAQLHPRQRERELARAVMLPTSGEALKRDVSDYIWMLEHGPTIETPYSDNLTDWISTFTALGQGDGDNASLLAHSIEQWKRTSSLPWLVAAISEVPASDPNAPALIESADAVKPDSPAFATVAYHTARLLIGQGKTDQARAKLDAILARRDDLPVSTVNQLAALRMGIARNLNDLLVYAPRVPLGFTDDGDSDELPAELDDQTLKELAARPLFDDDGAGALTRWLPLSVLMQAARSRTLPPRLRGQVALATFIRALLLGNGPAARELAPVVMNSFPQLKPPIDAWLEAKSAEARSFAAAFMMLQNPGLRFDVDPGPGRITALDRIDSLRDNWWPSRVEGNLKAQTYPGFLSAAQKNSADEEWRKLSAINAPNFLCGEAIEQARRRPNDERVPEALYRCLRAVHLGCSNSQGTTLARSAFVLLHRSYPKSDWADRGKLWYSGDNYCPGS